MFFNDVKRIIGRKVESEKMMI